MLQLLWVAANYIWSLAKNMLSIRAKHMKCVKSMRRPLSVGAFSKCSIFDLLACLSFYLFMYTSFYLLRVRSFVNVITTKPFQSTTFQAIFKWPLFGFLCYLEESSRGIIIYPIFYWAWCTRIIWLDGPHHRTNCEENGPSNKFVNSIQFFSFALWTY